MVIKFGVGVVSACDAVGIHPVLVASCSGSILGKSIKPCERKVTNEAEYTCVDDSLTMRKVLSRLVEREGYEELIAKGGMDAMDGLQANIPVIILTDIEMHIRRFWIVSSYSG